MVCDRHEEVMEQLDDHEDRIKYLELSDTETKVELKNLIVTVKELITELKEEKKMRFRMFVGATGAVILLLLGFVLWYIQQGGAT